MNNIIAEILEQSPSVKYYAVASADLARRNATKAAKRESKPKRKKFVSRQVVRWEKAVDDVVKNNCDSACSDILARIESLPLNAIRIADTTESADVLIDEMAGEIRIGRNGIGVWEQFVSDEVVFVWLWNDV